MIFDLDFVDLELKSAQARAIPDGLTDHPVFHAIAFHESQLDRPELDGALFRRYLHAAARGRRDAGALTSCLNGGRS